jgi:predicted phosphodiesterase
VERPLRVACLADTHGHLPPLPEECDLLVLAGDVTPIENHEVAFQREWLLGPFSDWIRASGYKRERVILCAGNHDFIFQAFPGFGRLLPVTYLADDGCLVETFGLRVWASPWSPDFGYWAFMGPDHRLAAGPWALIGRKQPVDLLIVHGPPFGCVDETVDGARAGSLSLTLRLLELAAEARAVPLVITGHIHEARGTCQLGRTTIANVAYVDGAYDPWPAGAAIFERSSEGWTSTWGDLEQQAVDDDVERLAGRATAEVISVIRRYSAIELGIQGSYLQRAAAGIVAARGLPKLTGARRERVLRRLPAAELEVLALGGAEP